MNGKLGNQDAEPSLVGGGFHAKNSDRSRRGSKHRCDGRCNLKQSRSVVGLVGSRSGSRRVRRRRYRRKRSRDTAVLPVWLLRLRPVPLRPPLPKRLERIRLGAGLLVGKLRHPGLQSFLLGPARRRWHGF
jgi:hypothetical protein